MEVHETAHAYQAKRKIFTYQEYLNFPDDRNRYEIHEGELIMVASPITIHQRVHSRLQNKMTSYVENHNLGIVFYAPYDVVFSNVTVLQPDIFFVSNENKSIITNTNIQGSPNLVVEILSESTYNYDLFDKKAIYEKYGVQEYWIVDPLRKWIELSVWKDGKYDVSQRAEKTGKISSSLLPGFEIDLTDIFKDEF